MAENERSLKLLEHKLAIRRIILEKLFLAMIVGLVAFLGNYLLKIHDSNLESDRFILEKRFQALSEIRGSYADITDKFTAYIDAKFANPPVPDLVNKRRAAYSLSISEFIDLSNKWNLIFSDFFAEQMASHVLFHHILSDRRFDYQMNMASFTSDVMGGFDDVTKDALIESSDEVDTDHFVFEYWDENKVKELGVSTFFFEHYDSWVQKNR